MDGPSVILVALLTSAATAAGTVYVIDRYRTGHATAPSDAVVPDLRGATETDARANANVAHIAVMVAGREPNAEAKSGTVIRQSVAAGQHVPRDYPLSIVLAEEVVQRVPSVMGVTVADATGRLEQRGYHLQLGTPAPDASIAVGLIIDQSPKADTVLTKGGTVTVQISTDIEVPKIVGVGLTQAKTDLEKLGLKPVVRWVALAETPTFVVLNQKPAPGEKVKPGVEIQLTVCR